MPPIRENLPYPSVNLLTEDRKTALILAPAYATAAGELNAVMQYLFHHFHFAHQGNEDYAKLLEEIAIAEMHHFDILGQALIRLGTNPVFTACPPQMSGFYSTYSVRYSTSPQKMLMDDIEAEKKAIEGYENMLTRLENEQAAAIIQRIIMDERLHLRIFTKMLESLVETNC